jgi:hypothetical protein
MSHVSIPPTLDPRAAAILTRLLRSGESESITVAEFLLTVAHNDEESADLAHLRSCAMTLLNATQAFLRETTPT